MERAKTEEMKRMQIQARIGKAGRYIDELGEKMRAEIEGTMLGAE